MTDTKDLFINTETVANEVNQGQHEDSEADAHEAVITKPKKPKKPKKPMDEDKKKILLERLAKGREQAKIRREQKAKGKELVEKKSKVKVESQTSVAVPTIPTQKAQVKTIDNSEDFTLLKNELAEIKKMLKNNRLSDKKKEALKELKKEVSMEIADTKKDLAPKDKPSEAVAKEITPIKVQGFSTIRNKRRKLRAGF